MSAGRTTPWTPEELEALGYTALVCPEEPCGCMLPDLTPCGEDNTLCVLAYAVMCDGSVCGDRCEAHATSSEPAVCSVSAVNLEPVPGTVYTNDILRSLPIDMENPGISPLEIAITVVDARMSKTRKAWLLSKLELFAAVIVEYQRQQHDLKAALDLTLQPIVEAAWKVVDESVAQGEDSDYRDVEKKHLTALERALDNGGTFGSDSFAVKVAKKEAEIERLKVENTGLKETLAVMARRFGTPHDGECDCNACEDARVGCQP